MYRILSVVIAIIVGSSVVLVLCSCTDVALGNGNARTSDNSPSQGFAWKLPNSLTFCGEQVPLNIPEVKERAEREFFLNLQSPGQIILYIKRSGRFFDMYEKVFKEQGLPTDLKYVSVAESALFMARSSKDAVGLWQFIPATARAMGLMVTDQVDERRHPMKSTYAAGRYLKSGFNSIGSWTNAAAGYNMGHENFSENLRYQKATSFYELYLNEETSRYVLRIAVIKHIIEHAADYGINLPEAERYSDGNTSVVTERESISSMSQWAFEHGTTYKNVKLLNPWILGRSLPAPSRGEAWEISIPK